MIYPEDSRKTELIEISNSFFYYPSSENPHCGLWKTRSALATVIRINKDEMAEVHDLIAARGKKAAIEAGWPADLVHAAGVYLSDEDVGLSFAY